MFYHKESNTYIREGIPFVINEVQYPANWLNLSTPEDKSSLGIEDIVTVGTREDTRYYYVTEELVGSELRITNIRKSEELIAQMEVSIKNQEIDRLERETLLPRVLREYLLSNINDPTDIIYTKVKALDDKIKELRS